ncbi:MAG: hypothetical protein DRP51_11375 [Candidatus Zixiibacteriota bacterium]|nr:MAG: hypothetical protein DRP51_11375 [candidate division Zixibacteria bacterium]
MRTIKFLISLILLFAVSAFADYEDTQILSLSADGIEELQIDCGAGYLQIKGVDGLATIEVEAEIYIEGMRKSKAQDFIEDNMNLSLRERGKTARLNSNFDNSGFSFGLFTGYRSAGINLTINVPKNMILDIDDGSGDIIIEDIENEIEIDDGSGDIEIENVIDRLDITDGSGDLRLTDIEGDIRLNDGSGELIFDNIKGNIDIDDGSGDIEFEKIIGSIELDDGSGEIDATGIEGDFFIDDGSGNIDIRDVTGDVEIDDSSGDMEIVKIGGTVIVEDGSGSIRIDDVRGDVEIIDDDSGRCRITNVDGRIKD